MDKYSNLPALSIAEAIAAKRVSRREVADNFCRRIKRYDPALHSFVEVYEQAPSEAGKSKLAGVPIAIKDNICLKGKTITCASPILAGHKAVYDATVITKLKEAGLHIIGTTNMDEFAFGSSTESSCYGPAKNPWNQEHVVGGSSGGSACAVSLVFLPLTISTLVYFSFHRFVGSEELAMLLLRPDKPDARDLPQSRE